MGFMRAASAAVALLISVTLANAVENENGSKQDMNILLHRPAKELFGAKAKPASMAARSIGSYVRGCLAGGVALPVNGETWQVMRLTRNRNWGHPRLVAFVEKLAGKVSKVEGWRGLLVGDLAQPRGGPMTSGHTSHQLGLDADIWLTPMPDRRLSREEREELSATEVVNADRTDVDPNVWKPSYTRVIRAAATEPEVERIFVNAAIKKALCREAGSDRGWLAKVRPWWGHSYHFHVRLHCPAGQSGCEPQPPIADGDGCDQLGYWMKESVRKPQPAPVPPKPKPGVTLSQLPAECRQVLLAP
ncbi:MAG: penicillin-insensitive murein DD-endopeptidase [Variibacter sp.]|nr:penicillin-insensitive murein DD-endopeptidase [Variibacter sp.]